ncbi:uncharacterized protein LOC132038025 [Lycium ferocissimum]|uniref:uncharacterized protein LOC132038025 n=1 Tax=Lycium ferocissimum TaxID=112874 RepID=UPI00281550B5|nr:uncharacterized protein LOC132038025 [Lycium ferocissimum]
MVYAKSDAMERLALWNSLYVLADGMVASWLIGGDFNVILNEEEKIGGLPVLLNEYEDFAFCLNSCELIEAGFKGSPFTWWNGRSDGQCIFKRLDRMLYNNLMQQWFGFIEVDHLSGTGSDHALLLLSCNEQQQQFIIPLKFLKFWVDHESFQSVVTQNWHAEDEKDVFLSFKKKVKKIKVVLSAWSRQVFGDIFKQLTIREDIVRIKEQLFEEAPTEVNRMVLQRAQLSLRSTCTMKRSIGDKNLVMIVLRRGIETPDFFTILSMIESANEIADEEIAFYHKQFTQDSIQNFQSEVAILDHIPSMLSEEENADIVAIPTMEEVKQAVFELSGDSASGPDRLTGIFYQSLLETVGVDVFHVVKKNELESFSDMRPISLSDFINKVISRVVHNKLEKALPRLIAANQSGFVKVRNIIENVLLTQEIVSDIG